MDLNYFQSFIDAGPNKEYIFPTLRIARIVSGKGEWQIGEKIYPCSTGSIFLLNNLTPRKMINIHCQPIIIDIFEFLPFEIQNRPLLINAFYDGDTYKTYNNKETINELLSIISNAYSSVKNKDFYYYQMQAVFSLIEESQTSTVIKTHTSNLAFQVAKFIWNNFSHDINVENIAQRFNVSKNHLEKIFKNTHGVCVGEYLRLIRVYNAIERIKNNPEISVLDLALNCGFNSSSGFYKAYKTITGKKPRQR